MLHDAMLRKVEQAFKENGIDARLNFKPREKEHPKDDPRSLVEDAWQYSVDFFPHEYPEFSFYVDFEYDLIDVDENIPDINSKEFNVVINLDPKGKRTYAKDHQKREAQVKQLEKEVGKWIETFKAQSFIELLKSLNPDHIHIHVQANAYHRNDQLF